MAAAMELLAEVGPRRITMAEVARRAGVSRMTMYRRYDSLDKLISAVLTAEMAQVVTQIAQQEFTGSGRERVVQQTTAALTAMIDHTLLQRVLTVDPESLLPVLVERVGSGQRLLADYLATQLAAGMADGSIRQDDPALLALTIVTMAQPFVVGQRALTQHYSESAFRTQWRHLVDGYLRPEEQRS